MIGRNTVKSGAMCRHHLQAAALFCNLPRLELNTRRAHARAYNQRSAYV